MSSAPTMPRPPSRSRLWAEVLIVLGLSLGASAAYSIVGLANRLTRDVALGDQTTTINNSLSDRPIFDLIYQLMGIFFDLMPVALVAFLLWSFTRPRLGRLGIDFTRPGRDTLTGVGLALVVGIPGIAVYLGGRALGITLNVVPTALDTYWWTIPVLMLSAARAGITEEVIVIGIHDDYRGQSPKAFVKLKANVAPVTLEHMKDFLKDKLGKHEMIGALEIREALPRTAVGKFSKKELYDEEAKKRASV